MLEDQSVQVIDFFFLLGAEFLFLVAFQFYVTAFDVQCLVIGEGAYPDFKCGAMPSARKFDQLLHGNRYVMRFGKEGGCFVQCGREGGLGAFIREALDNDAMCLFRRTK